MLLQVRKFHATARRVLAQPDDNRTLGEFLADGGYSSFFAHHLLLPVVACVWSCGFDGARNYPARYLFTFLENHGLLAVTGSPQWRTVVGGSRSYVQQAVKALTAVQTATPVRAVTRSATGVTLRDDADQLFHADRVVVATHPDQALDLLTDATDTERRLLGAFEYTRSHTVPAHRLVTAADRVQLLTSPRVVGHVFNPLSVYHCSRNGEQVATVAEVHNTYGGRHVYV